MSRKNGKLPKLDFSGKRLTSAVGLKGVDTCEGPVKVKLAGNLFETVPAEELASLDLKELDISKNSIRELSPQISSLQSLEVLNLASNRLRMIGEELLPLSNLRSLDLASNQLTVVPPVIAQMVSLQSLRLAKNIIHILPPALTMLTNLQELDVSGNPLIAPPADVVSRGTIAIMQHLEVTSNNIGASVNQFSHLHRPPYISDWIKPVPDAPAVSRAHPKTLFVRPEPKEAFSGYFYVSHSVYTDQGCREYMEDTYIAINHMTLPYSESSKRRRRVELASSATGSVSMTGASTSALLHYGSAKHRVDEEGAKRKSPRESISISTPEFRRRSPPGSDRRRSSTRPPTRRDEESIIDGDGKDVVNRSTSTELKKKQRASASRAGPSASSSSGLHQQQQQHQQSSSSTSSDTIPALSASTGIEMNGHSKDSSSAPQTKLIAPLSTGPAPKLARLVAQQGADGGARRSSFHSSSPTMITSQRNASTTPTGECMALFAVFDGHAGPRCSKFLKDHFAKIFFDLKATRRGEIPIGLYKAFAKAENQYCQVARAAGWPDGSTGVVAVVHGHNLLLAHVGDSRAVLCRGKRAIELTNDHKPDRADETERILSIGGTVEKTEMGGSIARVNGHLAVSRSFGDLRMKEIQRYVSAEPEMNVLQLTPDDKFIILASDGLWDVLTNQEAVDFVRKESNNKSRASRSLVKRALKIGTTDNVSALVVWLTWVHNTPVVTGTSKINLATSQDSSPAAAAGTTATTGENSESQENSPPASPRGEAESPEDS